MENEDNQKGSALIMVLWIALFASILLAIAIGTVRSEAKITQTLENRFKAQMAAEGVIKKVAYDLATRDTSRNPISFPVLTKIGDLTVEVSISPEMQKVDINLANETLLKSMFLQASAEEELASRLAAETLDWRDKDDFARINGAEAKDYTGIEQKIPPQNRPFIATQELSNILSINATLFDCVAKLITIHGASKPFQSSLFNAGDRLTLRAKVSSENSYSIPFYQFDSVVRLIGKPDLPFENIQNINNLHKPASNSFFCNT